MSALPEGVTIREGGYYRRRDGQVVGPAEKNTEIDAGQYPWWASDESYTSLGAYFDDSHESLFDLVEEVAVTNLTEDAVTIEDLRAIERIAADVVLPIDSQARKDTPIFSGVARYFPLALAEIARLSKAGNDKHNPGEPLHWSRGKSNDHADCAMRHLIESGTRDPDDGHLHTTKLAWRALAMLQIELENLSKGGAVSS